jgi:hypothetical protein
MHFIFLILVALVMAPTGYAQDNLRVVRAVRTTAPTIDGVFEAEWLKAEPADHFIQRRPVEGAPESHPTRVYLLYDDQALSVCFVCNQPQDSISARVQRRDNSDNSDLVGIYLDSFHDRRNCYYFAVTASGGQIDGVVSNEDVQDATWDGVWESAVGRTDSGWVAEMRIPFSAFRHGGAREDGWGTNFVRSINLGQEALFWQPVSNQRGLRVNEFGILAGLENIGSSGHLEVLPHAVGRLDAPQNEDWRDKTKPEDVGVYLKYVPASSWTADFAYQPDFAQVDVDYEVIELTDYPIFYPEKRPFFLEVGNFFDTSPIQLLYTRRITDPDYVGRLYSQSDKFRGMVLGGQNRTPDGRGQAVGAGRAMWNLGKQSSIGVTGTFLNEQRYFDDPYYYPREDFKAITGGLDTRIRWGSENRWTIAGTGAARLRTNRASDMQPFEFRSNLYYDLKPVPLKMNLQDGYLGQDYNINDLGWGNSTNKIQHSLWLGNWWQAPKQKILQWGIDLNGWQDNLPDGRYGQGGGQINLYATSNGNLEFGGGMDWGLANRRRYQYATGMLDTSVSGEFRDNYFEQLGRFDIEPHWYHTQWTWFETDDRRWLSYYTEASTGNFREGHKWVWNQSLNLKPRGNLETSLVHDRTQVWGVSDYDNYQPTMFRVWRWVTRYSPTLNLSFRGTLQWVEEDRQLYSNLLLAWNWHPGSWFYVVYDEGRATNPLAYNTEGDRRVQGKLTYFFTVK